MAEQVAQGRLGFACDDPDAPANWPRVLTVWRANLLGSSAKGNEYFLRHLLGTDSAVRAEEAAPGQRPEDVAWREEAPRGKLDLLLSLDFRMTSTTLFSDIVLPAATWYEKHDLSSTDMHPFVHAFTPAIDPPWQTRTDFAAFHAIARAFSDLAATHLGVRTDLVAAAAAARHARTSWPPRTGGCTTGADGPAARCRDATCPSSSWWSATTARSPTRWPRSARCWTGSAPPPRGSRRRHRRGRLGWPG